MNTLEAHLIYLAIGVGIVAADAAISALRKDAK